VISVWLKYTFLTVLFRAVVVVWTQRYMNKIKHVVYLLLMQNLFQLAWSKDLSPSFNKYILIYM